MAPEAFFRPVPNTNPDAFFRPVPNANPDAFFRPAPNANPVAFFRAVPNANCRPNAYIIPDTESLRDTKPYGNPRSDSD
jgi:hypothetical protein